jgi:hypothetical protein
MSYLVRGISQVILGGCLVCAFGGNRARAEFLVDWYKIAGGGGASNAEDYSLVSTVGQAHAGTVSGGDFAVQGGFWGFRPRNQVSDVPVLRVAAASNNTLLLSWSVSFAGFVLEESDDPATVAWSVVQWTPIQVGSEWRVTVPLGDAGSRFYRLRLQ